MYEVSADWVTLYLWFHLIMAGLVFAIWLYQLPEDEEPYPPPPKSGDDFTHPIDEDSWPDWR